MNPHRTHKTRSPWNPVRLTMSVELRHLRAFVAVAEELNFTRAADRLHLAQQALSKQIRQLEEQLGTQLLDRTTRKVELTPSGLALLEHARTLLGGADRAVAADATVRSEIAKRRGRARPLQGPLA